MIVLGLIMRVVLAAIALLVAAAPLRAQPGPSRADSIESMTINADHVFVGRITQIGGQALGANSSNRLQAVFTVEESLKGVQADRGRQWPLGLPDSLETLEKWQSRSARLLVAATSDGTLASPLLDLDAPDVACLRSDFWLLRGADDILQAARRAISQIPTGVRRVYTYGLTVPWEIVQGTSLQKGAGLVLNVPVGSSLEQRALDTIRFETGNIWRNEAVGALRYFKSDENIGLLRSLLGDTTFGYNRHAEQNMGIEVRIYTVRRTAYEILKEWGVEVPEPVTRVEVSKPELVTLVDLSNKRVSGSEIEDLARFANLKTIVLFNSTLTSAARTKLDDLERLRPGLEVQR